VGNQTRRVRGSGKLAFRTTACHPEQVHHQTRTQTQPRFLNQVLPEPATGVLSKEKDRHECGHGDPIQAHQPDPEPDDNRYRQVDRQKPLDGESSDVGPPVTEKYIDREGEDEEYRQYQIPVPLSSRHRSSSRFAKARNILLNCTTIRGSKPQSTCEPG